MRVSREEKAQSRVRIIDAAARLFRARGLDGASVADVMQEAGLTHGGFYRHFASKNELVVAALDRAFDTFLKDVEDGADPEAAVARFRRKYLSDGHLAHVGEGCPLPSLGADVSRADGDVRQAFTRGVQRLAAVFVRRKSGPAAGARADALREVAMLVGAVVLARASTPEVARDVLAACRKSAD